MCIEFVIQVLKQKNAHVSFGEGIGLDGVLVTKRGKASRSPSEVS